MTIVSIKETRLEQMVELTDSELDAVTGGGDYCDLSNCDLPPGLDPCDLPPGLAKRCDDKCD